ncbi:hypothetical protein ZOSMA_3G00890 [Zostera marina]|uniref:Peroxisomal membrane 22 kDa (Mpv17/PMP22) family protein n=1 Tax=Zostera marina TaxID=29655 RepID=A0A0K9P3R3_ZOSMR|nr:hypothetical protein ZOSMA_3G00890 [Zostera marina]
MVFAGGCAASLARRVLSQYQAHHFSRVSILRPCDLTGRLKSYTSAASTKSTTTSRSKRLVNWYLEMIESRPILTKSITASLIFTVADLSSQTITIKPSESLDLVRTFRMAGYGMLISGPTLHFWFNFLSKVLPKRDVLNTLKKIFVGQTVYGPIITTVFFSQNAAFQGESFSEILARLKRDLIPTFLNGMVYWPLCDFITFKFVPVRLQPLVSNSFSFVWTIYLTYMASLKKADKLNISADDSSLSMVSLQD